MRLMNALHVGRVDVNPPPPSPTIPNLLLHAIHGPTAATIDPRSVSNHIHPSSRQDAPRGNEAPPALPHIPSPTIPDDHPLAISCPTVATTDFRQAPNPLTPHPFHDRSQLISRSSMQVPEIIEKNQYPAEFSA